METLNQNKMFIFKRREISTYLHVNRNVSVERKKCFSVGENCQNMKWCSQRSKKIRKGISVQVGRLDLQIQKLSVLKEDKEEIMIPETWDLGILGG